MHDAEWLEADGLGGFAMGTVSGIRTRRYHGLLTPAIRPPTARSVLVNGFDAWIETPGGAPQFLTAQRYLPDVGPVEGSPRLAEFTAEPWPAWRLRLDDGRRVECELFVPHRMAAVAILWRLLDRGDGSVRLVVRPFLSGRDLHATHRENPGFRFEATVHEESVVWQPYPDQPSVRSVANARYAHDPLWYRGFQLDEERARGLDWVEDLGAPGHLTWNVGEEDAVWILRAEGVPGVEAMPAGGAHEIYSALRESESARRARFPSRLHRSADAYLVDRGAGKTIIAGYPWFTDWGRDTFIALRGLCLAADRFDEARAILLEWAGAMSEGMLPNRFVEDGDAPEFNAVDASLWYIVAVHEYLGGLAARDRTIDPGDHRRLHGAVEAILEAYSRGTRYGIRADDDGLLLAGAPGVQLTWMDAKVGDWVVTPRRGKPVEIQALWLNALRIGAGWSARWDAMARAAHGAFEGKFWNAERGFLNDVVDVEMMPGVVDPTLRPNQIFAVGGLPFPLLSGSRARRVVAAVEKHLWTPLGLRSLAPEESGYRSRYAGGVWERDGAYHQGTVWPWLAGPFIEAWLAVRGSAAPARQEARQRFLTPLLAHLDTAGLGHVAEIADGDSPHRPGGCPFQAWSVGELLRIERLLDTPGSGDDRRKPAGPGARASG